jgi:glycosyltransferase involved in cell wall biosynthesis
VSEPARAAGSETVSVVIPALNEEQYLPALLRSLAAQTVRVAEIIVADAGSTDRTVSVARAGGARVVPGGMPAHGRNEGAAYAQGEWLLFLDADLELQTDALEVALGHTRGRRLDGMSCAFAPNVKTPFLRFNHWLSSHYFRIATAMRWPHSIGGFLLVRKEMHEALGGFDTTITVAEDQDYVRRLARAGRYAFLAEPVVQVAARRFESSGPLRMSLRWVLIELHRLILGEIRDDRIPYFEERPEPGSEGPVDPPARPQQSTNSISSG